MEAIQKNIIFPNEREKEKWIIFSKEKISNEYLWLICIRLIFH